MENPIPQTCFWPFKSVAKFLTSCLNFVLSILTAPISVSHLSVIAGIRRSPSPLGMSFRLAPVRPAAPWMPVGQGVRKRYQASLLDFLCSFITICFLLGPDLHLESVPGGKVKAIPPRIWYNRIWQGTWFLTAFHETGYACHGSSRLFDQVTCSNAFPWSQTKWNSLLLNHGPATGSLEETGYWLKKG